MNPFGTQEKYFNFLSLPCVQALLQSHSFVIRSIIRVCPRHNSRVTSLSPESYFLSFLICLPQWGVKGVAFHLWGVGMFSFSFSESNQGIGTEKLLWDLKGPLYKHTGGIHQQVLYCRQSTPCLVPSTRQFLV